MNIDAIASLTQALAVAQDASTSTLGSLGSLDFAQWIQRQLAQTNDAMVTAEAGIRRVALGDGSDLHGVMIQLEQAKLSFQLLVQVRTRVLEAYQEVMRMQV